MKVESMPVQVSKSTTRRDTPARILASPNSFMARLFRKEPLPSQRIQLNPSNFPTFIDESLVTNSVPLFKRPIDGNLTMPSQTVKLFH
jgi:hypothetical protein